MTHLRHPPALAAERTVDRLVPRLAVEPTRAQIEVVVKQGLLFANLFITSPSLLSAPLQRLQQEDPELWLSFKTDAEVAASRFSAWVDSFEKGASTDEKLRTKIRNLVMGTPHTQRHLLRILNSSKADELMRDSVKRVVSLMGQHPETFFSEPSEKDLVFAGSQAWGVAIDHWQKMRIVLKAHKWYLYWWHGCHGVHDYVVELSTRPTPALALALLDPLTRFAELFERDLLRTGRGSSIVLAAMRQHQGDQQHLQKAARELLEDLHRYSATLQSPLSHGEEAAETSQKVLWLLHGEGSPLGQLVDDDKRAGAILESALGAVVKQMEEEALGKRRPHSQLVCVGLRDWPVLMRWQKINVINEAQNWCDGTPPAHTLAEIHHQASVMHNLGHGRFGQRLLTPRQARRNSISAEDFRARWGSSSM